MWILRSLWFSLDWRQNWCSLCEYTTCYNKPRLEV